MVVNCRDVCIELNYKIELRQLEWGIECELTTYLQLSENRLRVSVRKKVKKDMKHVLLVGACDQIDPMCWQCNAIQRR